MVADALADSMQRARFRLTALGEAIDRLGPTSRHATSARFLWNLCKTAHEGLVAQLDTIAVGLPKVDDVLNGLLAAAESLHIYLAFVETGAVERVPQAMIAPLEALVRPLVPEGSACLQPARVLVYYDWVPSNYSFRQDFPTELRALLTEALDDADAPAVEAVPQVFAALSFPVADQSNVLLHSLLGHEMGHALVELLKGPPMTVGLPQGFEPELLVQLLSLWKVELLADAWAVFLLGPAAMLSLIELAPADQASDDHPCSHLRFSLMDQCLRRGGFVGAQEAPLGLAWLPAAIGTALERSGNTRPVNGPYAWAHNFFYRQLDTLVEFVFGSSGAYTRDNWVSDGEQSGRCAQGCHSLVWRILHYTPPDSVDTVDLAGRSPHLASVLNAGWTVWQHKGIWQRFCSRLELSPPAKEYEAFARLNKLLLKAMEIISIRAEWAEAMQ